MPAVRSIVMNSLCWDVASPLAVLSCVVKAQSTLKLRCCARQSPLRTDYSLEALAIFAERGDLSSHLLGEICTHIFDLDTEDITTLISDIFRTISQ